MLLYFVIKILRVATLLVETDSTIVPVPLLVEVNAGRTDFVLLGKFESVFIFLPVGEEHLELMTESLLENDKEGNIDLGVLTIGVLIPLLLLEYVGRLVRASESVG